jgi:hypothetical protein
MENHEFGVTFAQAPFDKLATETGESVAVRGHNSLDSSLQD